MPDVEGGQQTPWACSEQQGKRQNGYSGFWSPSAGVALYPRLATGFSEPFYPFPSLALELPFAVEAWFAKAVFSRIFNFELSSPAPWELQCQGAVHEEGLTLPHIYHCKNLPLLHGSDNSCLVRSADIREILSSFSTTVGQSCLVGCLFSPYSIT